MKTFNVTLTDVQVLNLIKQQNNLIDGYWIYTQPLTKHKTYAIDYQSDGGISFFGGNYQNITAEEAFNRIIKP